MTISEDALTLHRRLRGKIEIQNRISFDDIFDEKKGKLRLIYTPGVAYVALEISKNKELAYDFTSKWNNVAIICDGTRVLGLGNIGPEGAIPVMEGKSVLFKVMGGINAFPLCVSTQDKEEIIKLVKAVQPMFGAVNVEDIESPKVLEIVDRLRNELDIPVFHDDQQGTAVVTLAALLNALKLIGKKLDRIRVAIAGAGSAGYGIFKILHHAGCSDIIVADSKGVIYDGRPIGIADNLYKQEIARKTNHMKLSGNVADIMKGADVFIGVTGKSGIVNKDMVQSMNRDPIVFVLTNPVPEILPSEALQAGARIVATGRSDFPNQVNNAIAFPSLLRALLDLRIKNFDENMLLAAAYAIAELVDEAYLKEDAIVPKVNDPRILPAVIKTLKDVLPKQN